MQLSRIVGLIVGIAVLGAGAVRASDFVGVYCLPDRVVLEPNDTEPQRIQIWGAFLMTDGAPGGAYKAAERGYLYYACPTGKDSVCFGEWSDLKALAGTGRAVGLGMRYQPNGHVRKSSEPVGSPEAYPLQMGLTPLGGDAYSAGLLAQLKAAKQP
jgi:hypothetical protein